MPTAARNPAFDFFVHEPSSAAPCGVAQPRAKAIARGCTTEQARRKAAEKQRIDAALAGAARVLDETLKSLAKAGHKYATNAAVAMRCGVDEKTVRDWRAGKKAIPTHRLKLLPASIRGPVEAFDLYAPASSCAAKEGCAA